MIPVLSGISFWACLTMRDEGNFPLVSLFSPSWAAVFSAAPIPSGGCISWFDSSTGGQIFTKSDWRGVSVVATGKYHTWLEPDGLLEVPGIGETLFGDIADYICVDAQEEDP